MIAKHLRRIGRLAAACGLAAMIPGARSLILDPATGETAGPFGQH